MAAALTQVGISASISWTLARAVTGFKSVGQGQDSVAASNSALAVATWTELFAAQYTVATTGTQVVDLRAFTDLVSNSVTGTKAMAIIVLVAGAAADKLNVAVNASNGLVWPFHNTSSSIDIPGGGFNLFSEGPTSTGTVIDATHKQLLLTNNGSADLVVTVAVVVSDL